LANVVRKLKLIFNWLAVALLKTSYKTKSVPPSGIFVKLELKFGS